METYFIEFERGDHVRVKCESGVYMVESVDLRGALEYDTRFTVAAIIGLGVRRTVPVSDLELAT